MSDVSVSRPGWRARAVSLRVRSDDRLARDAAGGDTATVSANSRSSHTSMTSKRRPPPMSRTTLRPGAISSPSARPQEPASSAIAQLTTWSAPGPTVNSTVSSSPTWSPSTCVGTAGRRASAR